MRSASEIWETALGELQIQVSKPNYETWLKDTRGLSYHDNRFTVGVPNAFVGEWLNKHLRSLITKTLAGIINTDVSVQFSVCVPKQDTPLSAVTTQRDGGASQLLIEPTLCQLNPKYTFDTFVVGDCNRLAYSAALSVARKIASEYNPLFICGGTGLGKTHLLHAIGHATTANQLRTLYVTAEQFTNELIKSFKEEKTIDFHNKFRSVDVLLVDDIDFITGKRQIQEAFLHTFKELHTKNAQIVVTGDQHPKLIPLLNNKLRSRLAWGLVVELLPPEFDTRLAIVQFKAGSRGVSLSQDALKFLATHIQDGIRELEEALNSIIAYARLNKVDIDMNIVKKLLANIPTPENQNAFAKLIKQVVADYFGTTPQSLTSKKKDQNTSLARQVAMYLMKKETDYSLSQIGREFGSRSHSTVLYNCRKIAEQLEANPKLRNQIACITQAIKFASK